MFIFSDRNVEISNTHKFNRATSSSNKLQQVMPSSSIQHERNKHNNDHGVLKHPSISTMSNLLISKSRQSHISVSSMTTRFTTNYDNHHYFLPIPPKPLKSSSYNYAQITLNNWMDNISSFASRFKLSIFPTYTFIYTWCCTHKVSNHIKKF